MENQSPKINQSNNQEKRVFSLEKTSKKEVIKFDYEMLATKMQEMKSYEGVYIPAGHIKPVEEFLQSRGYNVETIYSGDDLAIKVIRKGELEVYLVGGKNESWLIKSCSTVLKIYEKKKYEYVYQALRKGVKHIYHIGELIYSFEEK